MRKDRQAGTVRGRLLLLTLALLAAFSLLLAVYGSVMVGDLRERMLLEAEEPLQSYMQEFHNRKESMEQYLSYLAVTNDAFQSLSAQSSREALYLASDALQNELAAMAGMSGGEYLIVLYHRGLDFMLAARQSVKGRACPTGRTQFPPGIAGRAAAGGLPRRPLVLRAGRERGAVRAGGTI